MPLSLNGKLKPRIQSLHGRWEPFVEVLTKSREDVLDYFGGAGVRGIEDGTVSPASSLEFSVDGSVRIAPSVQQDISHATGSAFVTELQDVVQGQGGLQGPGPVKKQALLVYELEAGRGPLRVTKITAQIHRKPDSQLGAFTGAFLMVAFRLSVFTGQGGCEGYRLIPQASTRVDASAIAWTNDEADVDFEFPEPFPETFSTPYQLGFALIALGGSDPENPNAAWVVDAAESDGEKTVAGAGTLKFWEMSVNPPCTPSPPVKMSSGGTLFRVRRATLPRAAIFVRENVGATVTQTFDAVSTAGQFDLGGATTDPVELAGLGETPEGTSLVFEIFDGSSWIEYVDGDLVGEDNTPQGGMDLSGVPVDAIGRYSLRWTFTGSADNLRTPVGRSIGVREIKLIDLSRVVKRFDALTVVDPLTGASKIPEIELECVRGGPRPDFADRITQLIAESGNISAAHVRIGITAPGIARKDRLHLDTYRIDDYDPKPASVRIVCVGILERLKHTIPKRKDVGGTWVVQPAVYAGAAETIRSVFLDVRDGQLGLAARYRGSAPEKGPIDDTGTERTLIQGQIGSPGVGTAGTTEPAKDVLDQLAYLAGGTVVSSQGKIHYRDIHGEKTAIAFFPSREIKWGATSPGLRARSPRFLVSYQPQTLGGTKDWDRAVEFSDVAIAGQIEEAGIEAGAAIDSLTNEIGRWIRHDRTPAEADGLAEAIARRHVHAFGAGLLQWRFAPRIPHPHLEIGDAVVVETEQFVARDPVLERGIKGTVNAVGVIVGRNLWGTDFVILLRGYTAIFTTKTVVVPKGTVWPLVDIQESEIVGAPEKVKVALRSEPEGSDVTLRYAVLDDSDPIPERSTDAGVWTSYAGAFEVTRDTANPRKVVAWGDHAGNWGPQFVAEVQPDREPEVLSITIHIDDDGDVSATIQADGDTGSVKVAASTSAFPSLATVQGATAVNGRNVTTGALLTGVALGATIYVSVLAYSRSNGGGAEGPLAQARTTRQNASVTKPLRIPHAELVPAQHTTTWLFGSGVVTPGNIGITSTFIGSVVVPKGVTITAVRAEMYRETTSDIAETKFRRLNDDHTVTLLATLTHSSTGYQTVSASLNQLVGDEAFAISVDIRNDSGIVDARFAWLEIDYTVPDYVKTY